MNIKKIIIDTLKQANIRDAERIVEEIPDDS